MERKYSITSVTLGNRHFYQHKKFKLWYNITCVPTLVCNQ